MAVTPELRKSWCKNTFAVSEIAVSECEVMIYIRLIIFI